MKRIIYILGLFLLVANTQSKAQIGLSYTTNCTHDTLHASLTGIAPISSGITADDNYTASLIPIGFTFNFYGVPYTQLLIGSNGNLCFDPTLVAGYDPWPISAALLGNSSVYNCICGPWCDIYQVPPISTGSILYATVGTAPNRKFECTWCGCAMFSCTTQHITTQIIIYEGTNICEVHIGHKEICTWNGGYAIVGVQNATGTAATAAPGRDYPSVWSILPPAPPAEAWRFTPTGGGTSYTCTSIPYSPIPYAASSVYWYDSLTGAYIDSGLSLVVVPTVTTTYRACAVGCNDTTSSYITVPAVGSSSGGVVGAPSISGITYTNPTACGACDGTITLHGVRPGQIDTLFYTFNGVAQPTSVHTTGIDSTITISGLCGGNYTNIFVKVGPCPSNIESVTLVTPILAISNETFTNITVCGACNGTIKLYGLTPLQSVSVAYSFNTVPATPITGTVGADSTFTLTGLCAGDYSGIVATVGLCHASTGNVTLTQPPLVISHESLTNPTVCGKCDGTITLYGLTPLQPVTVNYDHNGYPASAFSGTVAADSSVLLPNLCDGVYSSIAASIGGCTADGTNLTLTNPPITAAFDTLTRIGCKGDTLLLSDTLSQPSGYQFYWNFGDGTGVDSLHMMHVFADYPSLTGIYTVTLVYSTYHRCFDTVEKVINFYHPIKAAFTSDRDTQCVNLPINFTDTSSFLGYGGVTSYWNFGDNIFATTFNTTHSYSLGGLYTVRLLITDALGCQDSTLYQYYDIPYTLVKLNHHDTAVCLGADSLMLNGTVYDTLGHIDGFSYAWSATGGLGNVYTDTTNFNSVGTFIFTLTVTTIPSGSENCIATDTIHIVSYGPLVLTNVTPSQTIPYGSSIQLNADSALYYWWTPANGTLDNPNINNPVATPTDSTVYMVHGMSLYGCVDSQQVIITLNDNTAPFIPTGFSPNNDGENDYFKVVNLGFRKLVEMRIFNRWGNEVFETRDNSKGWDGTFNGVPQDIGAYTYEIILSFTDGTQHRYTGSITLIR